MENIKEELEKLKKDKIDVKEESITLIGKYHKNNSENFLGELICQTLFSITLVKEENSIDFQLIDGNFYEITGKLDLFPDKYSEKAKYYLQLKVQSVCEITKDNPHNLEKYFEARDNIAQKKVRSKKISEEDIKSSIKKGKKLDFFYIVSKKGNFQKSDILNDLYDDKYKKSEMSDLYRYYGIDFKNDNNILRVDFNKEGWQGVIEKIKEKKNNYSALVFIKGGGATSFFDDEIFCSEVLDMDIPFITAIGHSLDNEKLLCQLADINYKTPSYLGRRFLSYIFKSKNEDKISLLERKLKFKNILLLFLIPLVIFFNMVYLYFFSPRKEIINQPIKETMKVENKKETQTTKEEKNNLIEKVQEKISQKIEDKKIIKEDKKEISKVERKKRLVYSEDDVYTVLLWKGYKGEKAINNFQKDNGMKVTGKVDETLLKKLGVKYRFE